MRRLSVICLILSVCQLANAQRLEKFAGEKLVYQLNWSLLGLGGVKAGQASLWCQETSSGGYLLGFHGLTQGLAKKIYRLDNRATVLVDSGGLVQEISHRFTKGVEEKWRADYRNQLIYHSLGQQPPDTLEMVGHQPRDALSLIYFLRRTKLRLGDTLSLSLMGYDSVRRVSSWKLAQLIVVAKVKLALAGDSADYWQLAIKLDSKDNLFPGSNIRLYLTADSRLLPVMVESDLDLWGLVPSTAAGKLISGFKKDD